MASQSRELSGSVRQVINAIRDGSLEYPTKHCRRSAIQIRQGTKTLEELVEAVQVVRVVPSFEMGSKLQSQWRSDRQLPLASLYLCTSRGAVTAYPKGGRDHRRRPPRRNGRRRSSQ